ncbi:hypothetical protein KH5_03820 [Urechidicola sp. KH5]
MALLKKYLKSKPVCKVTFELADVEADNVAVLGSFNEWTVTPLKKFKNGKFKTTVDVPAAGSYEFRYIIDGEYTNDTEADAYLWNDYAGAENSVLTV